jgi:hypothetical protein
MGNGKSTDERLADLEQTVAYLSRLVLKARYYAESDPEVALGQARKSAEAICYRLFQAEIGNPGKMMLEDLMTKLQARQVIPPHVVIPLRTIQLYGNYGSHAQDGHVAVSAEWVAPCLSALAQVTQWYFTDYLGIALPSELDRRGGDAPPPTGQMGQGTAPGAVASPAPVAPDTPREPRPAPPSAEARAPEPPPTAPSPPPARAAINRQAATPQDIHGWPADAVQALQRKVAEHLGLPVVFRVPLGDGHGGEGPQMVVIPPGSYLMGAADRDLPASEYEKPQHRVILSRPFAIGRYALTFDEYDLFCREAARSKPNDKGWGAGAARSSTFPGRMRWPIVLG